jgi:hypothetical protein
MRCTGEQEPRRFLTPKIAVWGGGSCWSVHRPSPVRAVTARVAHPGLDQMCDSNQGSPVVIAGSACPERIDAADLGRDDDLPETPDELESDHSYAALLLGGVGGVGGVQAFERARAAVGLRRGVEVAHPKLVH